MITKEVITKDVNDNDFIQLQFVWQNCNDVRCKGTGAGKAIRECCALCGTAVILV